MCIRDRVNPLPLWCISPSPNSNVQNILKEVPPQGQVLFFQGIDNQALQAAYSMARAFLFPSLAEGFGWPIIEAQACGCPVITTDAPPMNEIGGPAASYIALLRPEDDLQNWAAKGASKLKTLLMMSEMLRQQTREQGIAYAARFNANDAIIGYLQIYNQVLSVSLTQGGLKHQLPHDRKKI